MISYEIGLQFFLTSAYTEFGLQFEAIDAHMRGGKGGRGRNCNTMPKKNSKIGIFRLNTGNFLKYDIQLPEVLHSPRIYGIAGIVQYEFLRHCKANYLQILTVDLLLSSRLPTILILEPLRQDIGREQTLSIGLGIRLSIQAPFTRLIVVSVRPLNSSGPVKQDLACF